MLPLCSGYPVSCGLHCQLLPLFCCCFLTGRHQVQSLSSFMCLCMLLKDKVLEKHSQGRDTNRVTSQATPVKYLMDCPVSSWELTLSFVIASLKDLNILHFKSRRNWHNYDHRWAANAIRFIWKQPGLYVACLPVISLLNLHRSLHIMEIRFFSAIYQIVAYFSPQMVTYIFCLICDYIISVLKSNYTIRFLILLHSILSEKGKMFSVFSSLTWYLVSFIVYRYLTTFTKFWLNGIR